MKQLKIRIGETEDVKTCVDWLNATKGNLYDPGILKYPTLRILCAYSGVIADGTPVAYLPTQRTLFLESLAVNPESPLLDRAQAFRDLVKNSELLASSDGIREIYMLCADENVLNVAEGHGFERVPYPLVRMKL